MPGRQFENLAVVLHGKNDLRVVSIKTQQVIVLPVIG